MIRPVSSIGIKENAKLIYKIFGQLNWSTMHLKVRVKIINYFVNLKKTFLYFVLSIVTDFDWGANYRDS